MLKTFYVTRKMPYSDLEDLKTILQVWAIEIIAIDQMAMKSIHEMEETERAHMFETREDAEILFAVEQLDLTSAENVIDEMLDEVAELQES